MARSHWIPYPGRARCVATLALVLSGCFGSSATEISVGGREETGGEALEMGSTGLRRLSKHEYDNSVRDLLGDGSRAGETRLPDDEAAPFDNNYATQFASTLLVESVEDLAYSAAARAVADVTRRNALVPCTPTGPADEACLRLFLTTFGRRVFRRPLTEEEVSRFLRVRDFSIAQNNFFAGIEAAIAAFLQHPRFLYLVERGEAIPDRPGLFRLDAYEVASRLSFFLLGSTPPDPLLDLAASQRLGTPEELRQATLGLWSDPRARAQVARFHALWLGFTGFAPSTPNRQESDALVERVVFDGPDHFELFRSKSTFVDSTLATLYGLPAPAGGSAWVSYASAPRQGILSHSTFLAVGSKFGDTSPTIRGKFIRERLFCQEIDPPPSTVDADTAPTSATSPCKVARYSAHASVGSCAACHRTMDPIGFGLENLDSAGRYRTVEPGLPECAIEGDGAIAELGAFRGVAEFSDMLLGSPQFQSCVTEQLFSFALGRHASEADQQTLNALTRRFLESGRSFRGLVMDVVSAPAFALRRE